MWRKGLLVLILLLVGCSFEEQQVSIESSEILASGASPMPDNTQPPVSPTQTAVEQQSSPTLTNLGPAPELTNDVWLNTNQPLRLADLRGNVVLLEMWTFG